MKNIFFALVAAAAVTCGASAQSSDYTVFNNPDNHPYFGVRLGVDISNTADATCDSYSSGAGFHIGAVYNMPLYQNLYFEPGLSIFYDTFGQQVTVGADPLGYSVIDGSIRNFGFRIPLTFGYFFDFTDDIRVAPFTGPQFNISLMAKDHWDDNSADFGNNYSIFGEGGFKHFDAQWVIGVGVTYKKYFASISGGIGMTKARSTSVEHFRRNTVSISIGYNF